MQKKWQPTAGKIKRYDRPSMYCTYLLLNYEQNYKKNETAFAGNNYRKRKKIKVFFK